MKFSIITVAYNCEETIEKTIKSVINQRNVEFEYIIIDGGSKDGTLEIINKYSNSFSYCISEPDEGIYDAMNKGIKSAKGEVLAFLNSGDVYIENALNIVNKEFDINDCDIVCGRVRKTYKGIEQGYIGIGEEFNPDELHKGNIYCHQGMFIKKELFDTVGLYNKRYKALADYDWNLKAYSMGYSFHVIPDTVAYYEDGGFSCTSLTSPLEYYEISLRNLNGKDEFKEYINNDYKIRKENAGLYLLIKEKIIFDLFKPKYTDIYIWGSGFNGDLCFDLYSICGYRIQAYIDSNPKSKIRNNIPVYTFEEFGKLNNKKNITIIVTPRVYDKEIAIKLINNGFEKDNIIMFSKLLEAAAKHYTDWAKTDNTVDANLFSNALNVV